MNNAISDLWSKVSIYCMNHDEPVKMEVLKNVEVIKTPFYACENYVQSESDKTDKNVCFNRLNLDDYQGIVLKFMDIVASSEMMEDFTNYKFTYKGARHKITVKVLEYSYKSIKLGIINNTVLGK